MPLFIRLFSTPLLMLYCGFVTSFALFFPFHFDTRAAIAARFHFHAAIC